MLSGFLLAANDGSKKRRIKSKANDRSSHEYSMCIRSKNSRRIIFVEEQRIRQTRKNEGIERREAKKETLKGVISRNVQ